MVVAEEADVALQAAEVREGAEVVVEIGGVVPDEQLVGHGAPAFDVLDELLVLRVGGDVEGGGEVAFDGAETGDDVVARADVDGRRPCVLIGEGLDEGVGEFLLDRLGHLVDEPDEQAGLAAVLFRQRVAVLAGAEVVDIVLAEAVHGGVRILPDALYHPFRHDLKDIRVAEAALHVAVAAHAADLAEVLRMGREELLHGNQLVEGVDEEAGSEADLAAVLIFVQFHGAAVALVVVGHFRVELVVPEGFAHEEGGNLRLIQRDGNCKCLQRRHYCMP